MYIPTTQSVFTAALALTETLKGARTIASGTILDYAVETCKDASGRARCTPPFIVTKSTCYRLEWKTEGALTHTTAEVRDAGSGELVFYRDTDGKWTPDMGELVYLDFKPKIPATGNQTVSYTVKTCE
ncbi:hypothetical protein F5Y02DRAFT_418675 [Annulohypoxylon stygium]|nr:hypothetical protein F5Y02DRAFT_418675 [Annulohypoxylon stygium]